MNLDGPQWRQLPLLMTHSEVGSLRSREYDKPVSELPGHFASGGGNRGSSYPDDPYSKPRGVADLEHVAQISKRIKKRGYDERFPLPIMLNRQGEMSLTNGNHRATAVHTMQHPLTPVVFHTDQTSRSQEQDRQDAAESKDYRTGRRKPLNHTIVDWRPCHSERDAIDPQF